MFDPESQAGYTVAMSTGTDLVKDPAKYIEVVIALLAFGVGAYLMLVPFVSITREEAVPPFAAAALGNTAVFLYGLIMTLAASWHMVALKRKVWPRSLTVRHWVTLLYFVLFLYFTILRILIIPEEIVWAALFAVSLICGILYLRLRLLI